MMKYKNFVAFILSHGRADNVATYKTLRKQGYTGRIVLVVDSGDGQIPDYISNFGEDDVYIFDKQDITQDKFDNLDNDKVIFFARNVCFDIAEKLGYKYFIELDDDYIGFFSLIKNKQLTRYTNQYAVGNMDDVFDYMIDVLNLSDNLYSICMLQSGDLFSPRKTMERITMKYKGMNSFVCDVKKRFDFIGRVNEDVNTVNHMYTLGKYVLSINFLLLKQKPTQQNKGGMTEQYLDNGTYVKSFYSIINCPSFVKIKPMGLTSKRIHHSVKRENCVVKLISQKHAD